MAADVLDLRLDGGTERFRCQGVGQPASLLGDARLPLRFVQVSGEGGPRATLGHEVERLRTGRRRVSDAMAAGVEIEERTRRRPRRRGGQARQDLGEDLARHDPVPGGREVHVVVEKCGARRQIRALRGEGGRGVGVQRGRACRHLTNDPVDPFVGPEAKRVELESGAVVLARFAGADAGGEAPRRPKVQLGVGVFEAAGLLERGERLVDAAGSLVGDSPRERLRCVARAVHRGERRTVREVCPDGGEQHVDAAGPGGGRDGLQVSAEVLVRHCETGIVAGDPTPEEGPHPRPLLRRRVFSACAPHQAFAR